MTHLSKNLELLSKQNAILAYQLQHFQPDALQLCMTQQEEPNLKRHYEGETYLYHSQTGALDEADDWFAGINLEGVETLFVYGSGLGYYYQSAKKWLRENPKHKIVFLEIDKEVLYRLFETECGTEMLRDSQVQIIHFENLFEDKALFNELAWGYVNSPFAISALKLYTEVNPQGCLDLSRHLSYLIVERKAFAEEYLRFGIPFFRNFYPNLNELPKANLGNALFGKFKGVPAIICGAGPSLNKNIQFLKEIEGKALLFAGSSALNALLPQGIIPDFGVAIDPNPSQLPRIQAAQGKNIPFFYRGRLHHDALKSLDGPRLYLTGSGGYAIAKWIENELDIEGEELDEGQNVVNFCIEIAHALGCNPIILAGVDLAYTDRQYYAKGVETSLQLSEKDFERQEDFEAKLVEREDIHGKPVATLWKWIAEAEWISEFAREHPELTLLNATEGGIGIKEVPSVTLQESINKMGEIPSLKQHIENAIQAQPLHGIQPDAIKNIVRQLENSLNRCLHLLAQLKKEAARLLEALEQNKPYPPSLQTTKMALVEHEIEEEAAYQALLETFSQVYMRYSWGKIQALQQASNMSKKKINFDKVALQIDRLTFLEETAHVNLQLIKQFLAIIHSS
ncbi:MAG: DUF115 domain-containing protein [Parachlamydia sp.]|jgi:hypothetical protein|nr:DUF115 domain-containing protein [Parachlamydia sp.]